MVYGFLPVAETSGAVTNDSVCFVGSWGCGERRLLYMSEDSMLAGFLYNRDLLSIIWFPWPTKGTTNGCPVWAHGRWGSPPRVSARSILHATCPWKGDRITLSAYSTAKTFYAFYKQILLGFARVLQTLTRKGSLT